MLSYKKLDSNLYKLLKSDKKMYLYELNNYLGYGILYDDFNKNYDYNDSIDFQNYVYKSLFNKEDDIKRGFHVSEGGVTVVPKGAIL